MEACNTLRELVAQASDKSESLTLDAKTVKILNGILNGQSLRYESPNEIKFNKELTKKIENVEFFSIRTRNALRRSGINVVGELQNLSEGQVKKIQNLGVKSANEVVEYCKKFRVWSS